MKETIELLRKLNIKKIYFCSGARNAPLLPIFKQIKDLDITICHDERSASFQALGHSKQTGLPSLICTTSGTALAECYPAFIEAYYSKVPLVVLSADRPEPLQGTRSPQTIRQEYFFGSFARTYGECTDISFTGFPVHINLPVNLESFDFNENKSQYINEANLYDLPLAGDNTLLVINKFPDHFFVEELDRIIQTKNLICYQEVESMFYKKKYKNEILFDKQVQKLIEREKIQNIISIGNVSNSKFWRNLNKYYSNLNIIELSEDNLPSLAKSLIIPFEKRHALIEKLESLPSLFSNVMNPSESFQELCHKFPEAELAKSMSLFQDIDRKGDVLFIGNSLPIRHLKFYKPKYLQIQANRGANGIDGLIATAAGVANSCPEKKVHLILGDLSFMYDFSSLFQINAPNLHIHVINNKGGKIFERVNSVEEDLQCNHHRTFLYWDMEFKFKIGSFQEIIPCPLQSQSLWEEYNNEIINKQEEDHHAHQYSQSL